MTTSNLRIFVAVSVLFVSLLGHNTACGQTPVNQILPLAPPAVVRMHTGGAGSGIWSTEQGLTQGSPTSTVSTAIIVNPILDPFPAPQAIYQEAHVGESTYTIGSLTPGASYPVNLHFAEIEKASAGQRIFNVSLSGTTALSNFDIVAASGGEFMALERTFVVKASLLGTISVQLSNGAAGSPLINAIEVLPSVSNPSSGLLGGVTNPLGMSGAAPDTGVYTITSAATGLNLDDDNTNASGSSVVQWPASVGNTNQEWQINKLPNGTYALICISNDLALDSLGMTSSGATLTETTTGSVAPAATQMWTITPTGSAGAFTLKSAAGLAIDSGGTANAGAAVTQSKATGSFSQQWIIKPVQFGAATPFVSYEGEWGSLGSGAYVISQTAAPKDGFVTATTEASGRAYVHLSSIGQSVSWVNRTGQAVTAINVRYSIPDAPVGGGIDSTIDLYVNGVFRQALPVTSKQTWNYETPGDYFGGDEVPGSGKSSFMFWDEVHAFIAGSAVNPEDTVSLRMDSQNSASYYDIDVVDLEAPPAPLTQPTNTLSLVSDCGATPNDPASDSTAAMQKCILQAETQNKGIWVPQGIFYVSAEFQPVNVTISGAGMWYSTVYFNLSQQYGSNNLFNPTGGALKNLLIDGSGNRQIHKYGINQNGDNWVIDSVWVQHAGPGIWAQGTNGLVENSRVNNSQADGININNGSGAPGFNIGNYLTVRNNFVRGSGDDGISVNDAHSNPPATTSFEQMINPAVYQNTVVAPWWANCLGIYGGINIFEANNVVNGGARENGLGIGPFGGIGGLFQGGQIQGNIVFQSGSHGAGGAADIHPAVDMGAGPVWNFDPTQEEGLNLRGNTIVNPLLDGMRFYSLENAYVSANNISSPSIDAIVVDPQAKGWVVFQNNSVTNVPPPYVPYTNQAPAWSGSGSNNSGFTPN